MKPIRIAFPSSIKRTFLFDLLERCYDVIFIRDDQGAQKESEAQIAIGADDETVGLTNFDGHTFLIEKPSDSFRQSSKTPASIKFSQSALVPTPFQNRDVSFID